MERHWTNKMKEEILASISGYSIFFTGVNKKTGESTTPKNYKDRYDIIFGYCRDCDLYIVWNGFLRGAFGQVSIKSEMIKHYDNISFEYGSYNFDKTLGEKKVLIPPKYIKQFCNNFIEYLMPNSNDKGFKKSVWKWKDTEIILDSTNCKTERPKRLTEAYERNPEFREKVLNNYEYKCAICYCDVEAVLEAHHIDSVSNNGSDSLLNGICLCRNHHKMVHSDLITLNIEDNTFDVDDSITKDVLTKWAIENYNKQLIEPINRRK